MIQRINPYPLLTDSSFPLAALFFPAAASSCLSDQGDVGKLLAPTDYEGVTVVEAGVATTYHTASGFLPASAYLL